MKVGLTSREVVFEEWDPDEVGEGVSGENDEHDQQNLAPMQMSKSEIFRFDLRCFHCSKEGHRQKKRKDLNLYIDLIFLFLSIIIHPKTFVLVAHTQSFRKSYE